MGFENRDYSRDENQSGRSFSETLVVTYLLLINIAVFLAQIFVVDNTPPRWKPDRPFEKQDAGDDLTEEQWDRINEFVPRESPVTTWLQLDPKNTLRKGQFWRLLTHAFCHSRTSLFHIIFNMLCLYWFGREIERIYGSREFLLFYLTAALCAAFAYLAIDWYTGQMIPAIGASGAVMGVMMLFTMHYPRHMIYLFFVIPIEMRWAMGLYVLVDLHPILLSLSGDRVATSIGHAAHLGGAAFGFLYYYFNWRVSRLLGRFERTTRPRRTQSQLKIYNVPTRKRLSDEETNQVDRVLAKISIMGQESLTEEEREILFRARDQINKKRDY